MTPEEFKAAMEKISTNPELGAEDTHFEADKLMCDLLTELGYAEGVGIFEAMHKWYA